MIKKPETYLEWIESLAELESVAARFGREGSTRTSLPVLKEDASTILICSPHPDDEAIVGLLPYRLRLEGWRVVNIAMTLGSRKSEHSRRRSELERSCERLGFECHYPFTDLTGGCIRAKSGSPERTEALTIFRGVLEEQKPAAILAPHLNDAHPTHEAVGAFLRELITRKEVSPSYYIESEFWATMPTPNLLVEASQTHLADLIGALSEHEGEVRRNPYHLNLPSWMQDTARRGVELVGQFGISRPERFHFATAYRSHLIDAGGELSAMDPLFWPLSQMVPQALCK